MRHALYLVGEPGAGKSTLADALTAGPPWPAQHRKPIAHLRYEERGVVELGARRANFSGTDALSMSAVVPASAWVQDDDPFTGPGNLLLAEGDRLAVDRFFEALLAGGWKLVLGHLATDPPEAARRRLRRGGGQAEAWVRGRQTKVARLVQRWKERVPVVTLDGIDPDVDIWHLAQVSPVAAAFKEDVWT